MTENPLGRVDPRVLLAAGWSPEELHWEKLMTQGGREAEALRLARETFAPGDARLGSSLIAQADALRARGDPSAGDLLREGVEVWRRAEDWVAGLKPERRSRSASYHLRLETRYAGQYDRFSEQRYGALYAEGLEAAEAHLAGRPVEDKRGRWDKERPAGFNDARRLLAAVCLMPPRR